MDVFVVLGPKRPAELVKGCFEMAARMCSSKTEGQRKDIPAAVQML